MTKLERTNLETKVNIAQSRLSVVVSDIVLHPLSKFTLQAESPGHGIIVCTFP